MSGCGDNFMLSRMSLHPIVISRTQELLSWAKEQYELQVAHRPDVNVHKRTLHGVWTQVITKLEESAAEEMGSRPKQPTTNQVRRKAKS